MGGGKGVFSDSRCETDIEFANDNESVSDNVGSQQTKILSRFLEEIRLEFGDHRLGCPITSTKCLRNFVHMCKYCCFSSCSLCLKSA